MALAIWLFLFLLLTLGLGGLWKPVLDHKGARLVLAPGFLGLLILKHLACLLAVAKTRESKPFGPGDEVLTHGDPKLPGIGNLLIAAVPFFGLMAAFGVVQHFLAYPIRLPDELPALPRGPTDVARFFGGIGSYLQGAITLVLGLGGMGWGAWLATFLAVNVLLALRPSFRDLKYLTLTVVVLALLGWLLDYFGIGVTRRTEGVVQAAYWTTLTLRTTGLLIALALLLLAASGATLGVARFWTWVQEGRQREKTRQQAEKAHQKNG